MAIQRPSPDSDQHSVARAYHWVSIVTTSVALMVLPGLGGQWLDGRFGTRFLALIGFAFGLVGGIGYLLLAMTASESRASADGSSVARKKDGEKLGE